MTSLRVAFAVVLVTVLGVPVILPVIEAVGAGGGPTASTELTRSGGLAANTLALAAGACAVAVPVGTVLAVVLERVHVPGRRALRGALVAGLFVPLPVSAVAWQIVLGTWLPPLALEPGQVAWRPWNEGLAPAVWVHGMAGVPWVVWIVAAGLRAADRGLEEDALLNGGPARVFRWVLLPRAALASAAAAGWVTVQAVTEIPITDAMMVRTFAEEVYTQIVSVSDAVTGAVVAAAPAWAAAILVGTWVARRTARAFDAPPGEVGPPVGLRLRVWQRIAAGLFAAAVVATVAVLPVAALVWKAGGGGTHGGWTAGYLLTEFEIVVRTDGRILLGSVGAALATGVVTAGAAWLSCWLADGSRWFARLLFALCVVLAVAPGPLVGLGLKDTIRRLVDVEADVLHRLGAAPTFPPLRSALYDQPSPIPAGWAAAVRLFPLAVAVLWPAVRAVPRDLLEAVKLDGLGPFAAWRLVLVPLTGPAVVRAAIAVAALALGEVSAGKLVNPPFRPAFIFRLFDQMHYGAESTVAALCLLQLAATAAAAALLLGAGDSATFFGGRARTG